MSTRGTFVRLADNLIELVDLTDNRTGTLVAAATVTVTVKDRDGVALAGVTWPLSMPAVAGAPGFYRATLPLELDTTDETRYEALVVVNAGAGLRRTFRYEFVARDP